jgi:RNA polymerase sigma factor (sigma-70 family)
MEIEDLIKGCASSDRKAQSILFKMFYTKMIGVASRYSNGGDDVEDLVQEAFISIYKNIPRFTGKTINQLAYWVHNIIKNKTLDLYRKNKKISMVEIHDNFFEEEEQDSIYEVFINDVPTLIESLSPQYKKVVTLYYLEDKSHQEISEILGISISSSKTNLLRSKKKMKKTLAMLYPTI